MIIYEYNISSFGYMIRSPDLFTAAWVFHAAFAGVYL